MYVECAGCGNPFDAPRFSSLCAPCVAVAQRAPLNDAEKYCYMWQNEMLGGFQQRLAQVIAHADVNNQALLRRAYPAEVYAITSWQHTRGFADAIREKGWEC